MNIPYIMLRSLLFTIIIEVTIAYIFKIRNKKDIINIILANIITNPLVVTIPIYFNFKYSIIMRWIMLIILEVLTVIFEGYVYQKYLNYKKINPYILSTLLNITSYLIGEFLNLIMK